MSQSRKQFNGYIRLPAKRTSPIEGILKRAGQGDVEQSSKMGCSQFISPKHQAPESRSGKKDVRSP